MTSRIKAGRWTSSLIGLAILGIGMSVAGGQTSGASDLASFLDKAALKIRSYPEKASWTANTVTTITKMDRNWIPESVTVVAKTVRVTDGEREESILKAEETKKGKTRDITRKYAEDAREARERERKRRSEANEGNRSGRRSASFSIDEFLPFAEPKRGQFYFLLTEKAAVDGRPAVMLEVTARVKSEKNWEGKFYFDPETTDLLGLEVRPSENPSLVKELEFRATFEVLDGRVLVVKSTRAKVNGGFFLKHIRQVIEETSSGFELTK